MAQGLTNLTRSHEVQSLALISGLSIQCCHELWCPSALGVYQLSREIRAPVRVPAVPISSAGRLGTWSEGLWGRPAVPGISLLCPRDLESTSVPGRLGFVSEGPGLE